MDKKNRLRAGLVFGIGMTVFYILQNLLTNQNPTTNEIIKSIVLGIISGAISGVLFGWLIGLFANSKFVRESTKIATEPGEDITFETPANHFKGIEGVGGKLYLTNKRLIFKSHKFNIQNHLLSIKPLGVANNGLVLTINNNTTEKFVVEQVEDWIKLVKGEG